MKKHLMILFLLGCIAGILQAQSNLVAAGGDASGEGGSVSYSAGQLDYSTKDGPGGILTEGIQQPYEISIISGLDEQQIILSAVVFPNPTSDFVELRTGISDETIYYELLDVNGGIIVRNKLSGNSEEIDMSALSNGIYYLKVNNQNKTLKTFQVVKVH